MKKLLSIFFLVLILLPSVCKMGIFINFEMHREYIARVFCENRDKPMTLCYGSCYLVKQLKKVDGNEKQDTAAPKQNREEWPQYSAPVAAQIVSYHTLCFSLCITVAPAKPYCAPSLASLFRPPLA